MKIFNGQLMNNRRTMFLLAAILIVAALLRGYGLDSQSLWNDELSSWYRSNRASLKNVYDFGIQTDVHPPGYYVILFFMIRFFGDSALVLRLPSAIGGFLAVAGMFLLGRRLYGDSEGLIAAAFTAVLWAPIYYSQEARAYSLLLLFSIVTTYFWWDLILSFSQNSALNRWPTIGYISSSIVVVYLHYFGVLLIVLQAIGALSLFIRKRQAFTQWLYVYFLIGWAYLPWLPTFFDHLTRRMSWIEKPQGNAFISFLEFLFNESSNFILLISILFVIVFIINIYSIVLSEDKRTTLRELLGSPGFFLLLWLFMPFSIVYVQSLLSTPVLSFRNLIISLPAAYLLLARVIMRLPFPSISRLFVTMTLIFISCTNLLFSMNYYSEPQKGQFQEPVAYIIDGIEKSIGCENSVVIAYGWHKEYFDYYFEKLGSTCRVDILAGKTKDIPLVEEFIANEESPTFWYIRGLRKPEPAFLEYLNSNFQLKDEKSFKQSDVWFYEN